MQSVHSWMLMSRLTTVNISTQLVSKPTRRLSNYAMVPEVQTQKMPRRLGGCHPDQQSRPLKHRSCSQKLQAEQVGTEKFVAEVRKSIKASNGISLPDPDNIPANAIFRMIEFGPVVSDGPGRGLHSAPNPDLLQLRNLDAQCNRAYHNGELEGLPPH